MMTHKRRPPIAALSMMLLATALFTLFTVSPVAAQEPTPPPKPIGASPGNTVPPVKPTPETSNADQQEQSDQTTSQSTGVGPTQTPPLQVSPVVQASPSSQAPASLSGTGSHAPVTASH